MVKELGLSSGNMTNWKNGRKPKTDIALKIANYLDVSVEYLMGESTYSDKPSITDEDIKFALFKGDVDEITDEMYEEVKAFAEFVRNKYKKKD